MITLLSHSVWDQCTALARNASSTRAAIAYVGKDGATMLPLRKGDTIVVDGSRRALQAGSTHPSAINAWVKAGVHVYSKEGLHAKIILFDHDSRLTAIVGSANASGHSAHHLTEASVQTQDASLAHEVGQLIDLLVAESGSPLDTAWVSKAKEIYRPPSTPPRRRSVRPFPGPTARLWVSCFEEDPRPPSPAAASAAASASLDYGTQTTVESWRLCAGDAQKVRVGDGVALIKVPAGTLTSSRPDGRWTVHAPGVVLRVIEHRRALPEAIIAIDTRRPTKRFSTLRAAYQAHNAIVDFDNPVLPGPLRDDVLAIWID